MAKLAVDTVVVTNAFFRGKGEGPAPRTRRPAQIQVEKADELIKLHRTAVGDDVLEELAKLKGSNGSQESKGDNDIKGS